MKNKLLYLSLMFWFPAIAFANSALPAVPYLTQGVIFGFMSLLCGLMPIIIVEAVVFRSILKNVKLLRSFFISTVVNLTSTLAGFLLALVLAKSGRSLYYSGYSIIESIGTFGWFALFLFVNFLFSVFIEYFFGRILIKEIDKRSVLKAAIRANLISYLLLFLFVPLYVWIVNFR